MEVAGSGCLLRKPRATRRAEPDLFREQAIRDYGDRRLLVRLRDGAEILASRTASQELRRLFR